jgi:hypothetical protein
MGRECNMQGSKENVKKADYKISCEETMRETYAYTEE